jgi:anti-sigma factor RsiW
VSDHVIDRLSAYFDDELSANQRAVVDTHLPACHTCGALLDDLRTIVAHARLAATTEHPRAISGTQY